MIGLLYPHTVRLLSLSDFFDALNQSKGLEMTNCVTYCLVQIREHALLLRIARLVIVAIAIAIFLLVIDKRECWDVFHVLCLLAGVWLRILSASIVSILPQMGESVKRFLSILSRLSDPDRQESFPSSMPLSRKFVQVDHISFW